MKTLTKLDIEYRLKIAEACRAGNQAIKDQVVDTSKLIKPTDTVGKEELNCMIAHFENEDYKISVMVPGILPKDDGGELVRGCGLIVYDISKKVL
jgi:hypothetical protein